MIDRELAGVSVCQTGFWIQEVEGAAREGAVGGRTDSTATRSSTSILKVVSGQRLVVLRGPARQRGGSCTKSLHLFPSRSGTRPVCFATPQVHHQCLPCSKIKIYEYFFMIFLKTSYIFHDLKHQINSFQKYISP